jgi:hypothetical protein
MRVWNLPWSVDDLGTTPFLPPEAWNEIARARQVFVMMRPKAGEWQWDPFDKLFSHPPRHPEARVFGNIEVRVYRLIRS